VLKLRGQKDILDLVPKKFPKQNYSEINKFANTKYKNNEFVINQFLGGWNAIIYRYLVCIESDQKFLKLIKKYSDAPPQPFRYFQERELFNFFVNGLSIFDCFGYSAYMLCSVINPNNFIVTQNNLERIKLKKVKNALIEFCSTENLSIKLNNLFNSRNFKDFKEIRNILAHRESPPGRTIRLSVGSIRGRKSALWIAGIELNENTTSSRLAWMEGNLFELIEYLGDLLKKHY